MIDMLSGCLAAVTVYDFAWYLEKARKKQEQERAHWRLRRCLPIQPWTSSASWHVLDMSQGTQEMLGESPLYATLL